MGITDKRFFVDLVSAKERFISLEFVMARFICALHENFNRNIMMYPAQKFPYMGKSVYIVDNMELEGSNKVE